MLVLQQDNDTFQLVTGSAVSTDYNVTYDDIPGAQSQSVQGSITTATTTTLVAAPGPRVVRRISDVFIRNRHTSSTQTVTLAKTVSGTAYHVTPATTLLAGESLLYTNAGGFQVFDATGRLKTKGITNTTPGIMMPPGFQASDITSTRIIGPGWSQAAYIGKASRNLESITARLRVATAVSAGGATEWCEVAVAKGTPVAGAAPTLTVVGFTSAETALASVGMHNVIVSISPLYGLNEGDDVWLLVGSSAGTSPIIRAGLADNLQAGGHALVSSRPSAIQGTPTAFTLVAAAVSIPWLAGIV